MPSPWRTLWLDRTGAMAAEFALMTPIVLVLFSGVVDLTNVLRLDRKVVAVAQATADLVTQGTEIDDTGVNEVFKAGDLIVQPFGEGDLKLGMASVRFDIDSGTPAVDWSESLRGGTVADPAGLATGLGLPGESVVIVQAEYAYTPILAGMVIGPVTVSETAYSRPRKNSYVVRK